MKTNLSLVNSRRLCSKVNDCDIIKNDPNKNKPNKEIEVSYQYIKYEYWVVFKLLLVFHSFLTSQPTVV